MPEPSVLLKIQAARSDEKARSLAERFRTDGFAPFEEQDILIGFVRAVEEGENGYTITIEMSEAVVDGYLRGQPWDFPEDEWSLDDE